MKKVNFRNILTALAFGVVFLMLGNIRANAQVVSTTVASAPSPGVNYMTPSQATLTLQNTLEQLKSQLGTLIPGTQLYNATLRYALYYNGIAQELTSGKSVPEAIMAGFAYLNDTNGNGNLSRSEQMAMRNDATNLLKN